MVLASAKVREGKELSNTAYIPPLCSCHSVFPALPKLQYSSDKLQSRYITHGVLVKLKGGSVINTGAFSCNGVFVKTFSFLTPRIAEKLCKEQQMSFGNGTKCSDFIDGKYISLN